MLRSESTGRWCRPDAQVHHDAPVVASGHVQVRYVVDSDIGGDEGVIQPDERS